MNSYAELAAATNYSFLRGASRPSDMVHTAMELGYRAIGIADRNTVAGVVRAWKALKEAPEKAEAKLLDEKKERGETPELTDDEKEGCKTDLRLIVGTRLVFVDGTPDIIAYPATRKGWGRLTRLLTVGNMQAVKGGCILRFSDLLDYLDDLLLIVLPRSTFVDDEVEVHRKPVDYLFDDEPREEPRIRLAPAASPRDLEETLVRLKQAAPDHVWLGVAQGYRGRDVRHLKRMQRLATSVRVPAAGRK